VSDATADDQLRPAQRQIMADLMRVTGLTPAAMAANVNLSASHVRSLANGNKPLTSDTVEALSELLSLARLGLPEEDSRRASIDRIAEALTMELAHATQEKRSVRQSQGNKRDTLLRSQEKEWMSRVARQPGLIDQLPRSEALNPVSLIYGENDEVVIEDLLRIDDLNLSSVIEPASGDSTKRLIDLIGEQARADLRANWHHWLPRDFVVTIREEPNPHARQGIALYVATDVIYPQTWRRPRAKTRFQGMNERGGISAFIDDDGSYRRYEPHDLCTPETRLGGVALAFLVAFERDRPVARSSSYTCFVRKGIRYPGDQWWSEATGMPLANSQPLTRARIAFETQRPTGPGCDIYVCDFDGRNMVNATRNVDEHSSGILTGSTRQEAFRWTSVRSFECADNATGVWRRRMVNL